MKQCITSSRIFFLLYFFISCIAEAHASAKDSLEFSSHFRLLPQPQKIVLTAGKGMMYSDLRSFFLSAAGKRPIMKGWLATIRQATDSATADLALIIRPELKLPSPEGYILELKNQRISIQALTEAGLFYGVQTLEQMLEDSHDQNIPIPACRITDYPQIPFRAIHLDMKHHLEKGYYYYHLIDQLAAVKVNAIIVEFEDKLRYRKAPLVGSPNAISIEEFAAISQYAKERNIEISPLVQGLGHASFILKHSEYKHLRDDSTSDWVFDPLNEGTYDLQFALYEDALKATPYGKYLHVGGDEVGTLGKSALCKKSGMQAIDLQLYWLKKVTAFAKAHGRIPIFWDDMVFKLSGLYQTTYDTSVGLQQATQLWKSNEHLLTEKMPLFPDECVYMRWNYDDAGLPGNRMALDWYRSHGLKAMGATAVQCMSAMLPRNHSNFEAIKIYCRLTEEKGMQGLLCTAWDDCSPHFETLWRGFYDFALLSWHYQDMNSDAAEQLFRHRFYGPQLGSPAFEFQDSLEKALPFWETAFLKKGDRENYHKEFELMDLPDKNKPGSWSRTWSEKLAKAHEAVARYTRIRDRIEKTGKLACRNDYSLSVMNAINELQVYPATVLLLLEEYDVANMETKEEKRIAIRNKLNAFAELRESVETIYGESRILGNPEGYQLDSNFHEHLANGTNNTDWMYVYELAMNRKIRDLFFSNEGY